MTRALPKTRRAPSLLSPVDSELRHYCVVLPIGTLYPAEMYNVRVLM